MSRDQEQDQTPISHIDQLVEYFQQGCKSPEQRRVGTEHEKFVFRTDRQGAPLMQFPDANGIQATLKALSEQFGWEPDYDDGHLLTLTRDGSAISLEPAGQFELSGKPLLSIHETAAELHEHLHELYEVSGDYAAYLGLGLNPYFAGGELPWMPRRRYQIMRNYMAKQGALGHWMMQTTCTIQANFDYTSEEDAADIIHTSVLISPIVNAIFSNSPITLGVPSGYQSYRANIWTQTDSDRCGVPEFMYRDDFGFRDYVEYALSVPMYFIRRDDAYLDCSGTPFKHFLEHGWEGYKATMGDFELHLSTLFPEVRLKKYIEVRCCDGGPAHHITALPALWKGILYDSKARVAAKNLVWSRGDAHRALFSEAATKGIHLDAFEGRSMLECARDLIQIASDGLERIAVASDIAPETPFLEPLKERLSACPVRSAADAFQQHFLETQGDRRALIEYADLLKPFRQ